jgi:hypothetical protein
MSVSNVRNHPLGGGAAVMKTQGGNPMVVAVVRVRSDDSRPGLDRWSCQPGCQLAASRSTTSRQGATVMAPANDKLQELSRLPRPMRPLSHSSQDQLNSQLSLNPLNQTPQLC